MAVAVAIQIAVLIAAIEVVVAALVAVAIFGVFGVVATRFVTVAALVAVFVGDAAIFGLALVLAAVDFYPFSVAVWVRRVLLLP